MTTSTARHRKAARPLTPLTSAAPAARRGLAVAASSGLAITMLASGAAASSTATEVGDSAGSLQASGLEAIAAGAREAVTTNAALTVSTDVEWDTAGAEVTATAAPVVEETTTQDQDATATDDDGAATASTSSSTATTTTTQTAAASTAASANGSSIVALAMQYVGYPYVSGGSSPSTGFDCSGLVQYVYSQAGISLPRTSYAQGSAGTIVSAAEAQPGDIVYYGYHVGIYAGNGMMIDAGTTATGVVYRAVWGTPSYYVHIG